MLFEKDLFSPEAIGDEIIEKILTAAVDRASDKIRPSDILASVITHGGDVVLNVLAQALEQGSNPKDLLDIIEIYNPSRTAPSTFNGKRDSFSGEALEALDKLDADLEDSPEDMHEAAVLLLVSDVLENLDEKDIENLAILDAAKAAKDAREKAGKIVEPLMPLFDSASGLLLSDDFTEGALAIIENAAVQAAELGYDRILPPHCFLALLSETEGVAEHLVRLQAKPEISPGKVADIVAGSFRLSDPKEDKLSLNRDDIGDTTVSLLRDSQRAARLWGCDQIDTPHLLFSLLENMTQRLKYVLMGDPINIDIGTMREHLNQFLMETRGRPGKEVAFRLPSGLLPSEDLTYRARTDGMEKALHVESYIDVIIRALYRRSNNHVIITGLAGVGKSTLARDIARRAADGEIPFLKRKRFILADCNDISPQESKEKLRGLLSIVGGRTDVILCLDGLGPLLRAESGGNNKLLLRSALKEYRMQLIAVMSNTDFEDLLSSDHEMLELFTRVDVEEPDVEDSLDIVGQASKNLTQEYQLVIDEKAVERAVVLSSDYILNERLPAKALKILRRACEDLDFERTQKEQERDRVEVGDVIRVISEISGVPEGTLSGFVEKADYEQDLTTVVFGQSDAVKEVAAELRRIKAGRTIPGKPASVMMFAGLTGVGKTELAKALARFYSSSKRLQTYTMGNFTESHSISGIIGVPPGYVGHEQGGRLINDLNSDPYCVFLLDEAEKPHPDVWKPFLNLFDEGWIVDQRGVKAFADRAIFILTSNAGQETISRMWKAGENMEEIVAAVKKDLLKEMHRNSNQPVFSPEFLARIKRIIIFNPLDLGAMENISYKILERMQRDWKKLDKELDVPDALMKYIAKRGYEENEKSGGREGGRIIEKLMTELIESNIDREASLKEKKYKECDAIKIVFLPPGPALPMQASPSAKVNVEFLTARERTPEECIGKAIEDLRYCLESSDGNVSTLQKAVTDCLAGLKTELHQYKRDEVDKKKIEVPESLLKSFHEVCARIDARVRESDQEARKLVQQLINEMKKIEEAKHD